MRATWRVPVALDLGRSRVQVRGRAMACRSRADSGTLAASALARPRGDLSGRDAQVDLGVALPRGPVRGRCRVTRTKLVPPSR